MARWVDASDDQRFWQYTLPAAKARLAINHWDVTLERITQDGIAAKKKQKAAKPDSFEYRALGRELVRLRRDYKTVLTSKKVDEDAVREAERRSPARK